MLFGGEFGWVFGGDRRREMFLLMWGYFFWRVGREGLKMVEVRVVYLWWEDREVEKERLVLFRRRMVLVGVKGMMGVDWEG